jgi:hypothetical protein
VEELFRTLTPGKGRLDLEKGAPELTLRRVGLPAVCREREREGGREILSMRAREGLS